MKNDIRKLVKISVIAGLGIAPLSVLQAQVIVPKAEVASEVSVKSEMPLKKEKRTEEVPQEPKKPKEVAADSAEKVMQQRQEKAERRERAGEMKEAATDSKDVAKPKLKREKEEANTIEEIAKKAAKKSVATQVPKLKEGNEKRMIAPPVPTAERVRDRPENDIPQTNQEIAKKAAENVVKEKRRKDRNDPVAEPELPATDAREKMKKVAEAEKLVKPPLKVKPEATKPVLPEKAPVARGDDPPMKSTNIEDETPKSEMLVDKTVERKVAATTEKVEAEVNRKKMKIETPFEANEMIRRIIGVDSDLALSEKERDNRALRQYPRPAGKAESPKRNDVRGSAPREAVVSYLLKRLGGNAALDEEPQQLRRDDRFDDRRRPVGDRRPTEGRRSNDSRERHVDGHAAGIHQHPIYNGRRHVQYRDRRDVPAILLAVSALDRVQVQNYDQVEYLSPNQRDRDVEFNRAPELPLEYREPKSYVVSYNVDPNSMVSRGDVLFQQGSTAFADEYSYEIVRDLAAALRDPSMVNERFVIEGHASAEGGFEYNKMLSQRRAERIVRDMVRQGVSPDRLIPVGYGESEAANSENADERDRRFDRKVVVFRMTQ